MQNNLALSFPHKSVKERKQIEVAFYRHLADLLLETIKSISVSKKEAIMRYHVVNQELVENYLKAGKEVIAVAGHYGNWEMANILNQQSAYPCLVVYKPLTNALFDSFITQVRSRFGITMVPMKNILRRIVCNKGNPALTVMLSDQTPAAVEISAFTDFLNQPTAVFLGVEKVASLTRAVVVFIEMNKLKRGYYSARYVLLTEHPEALPEFALTKMHLERLEELIYTKPQYWLWSHKRWKHNPALIPNSKPF